ncbi:transglycosylase domain-containing protein [Longimycelium tulufanense]|nr:transglycosylase domain-containing protein [Longimycelium tulufanense]
MGPGGPGGQQPARPPQPGEQPTEVLPPLHSDQPREPELLTHYEPLPGEPGGPALADGEDYGDDDDAAPLGEEEERQMRRKRIWRRVRRTCYVLAAASIIVPFIAFWLGYFAWDVPNVEQVAAEQKKTITVYAADGRTELGKIAPKEGARTLIEYQDIPQTVKDAVVSAEDGTFWENEGFSWRGIAGAVWNQLRGREGGGSTLTQQYIKQATGADEYSYVRKFKEVVLAYKMTKRYSKEEVLTAYLNTVYFGRGANGVQSAAQAYFGKDAKDLDVAEAAVLAGAIQQPSRWDPAVDEAGAKARWKYVLDKMQEQGRLKAGERPTEYPHTLSQEEWQSQAGGGGGPRGQIFGQIRQEVEHDLKLNWDVVQKNGLKIVTTIDSKAQQQLEKIADETMKGQPEKLQTAVVAIDPNTGGVIAYYGGNKQFDYAGVGERPAGSAFKPFVAATALKEGRGIGDTYDGVGPKTFAGDYTVVNSEDDNRCGKHCSVREAMKRSVNTVFVEMAMKYGPRNVASTAYDSGISRKNRDGKPTLGDEQGNVAAGVALGMYPVRVLDMANAYATFANGGERHKAHLVEKVLYPNDEVRAQFVDDKNYAFDPSDTQNNAKIARNVTETMLQVADYSRRDLKGNRPVAAKTGTHGIENTNENSDAYMAGYTPQIATAVWVGTGNTEPIKWRDPRTSGKEVPIYGSGLPGLIWQKFMDAYLQGKPVEKFPPFQAIGRAEAPKPSAPLSRSRVPTSSSQPPTSAAESSEPSPSLSPSISRRPGPSWPDEWPTRGPEGPGGKPPGNGGGGGGGGHGVFPPPDEPDNRDSG